LAGELSVDVIKPDPCYLMLCFKEMIVGHFKCGYHQHMGKAD